MQLKDNKATLCLAILSILCAAVLPYIPQIPAAASTSFIGALGSIGMLIKTYTQPPAKLIDEPKP